MSDIEKVAATLPERVQKYGDEHGLDNAQRVMVAMVMLARQLGYIAELMDYGDEDETPGERVAMVRDELTEAIELAQYLVLPIGRDRTIRLLTELIQVNDNLSAGQFVAEALEMDGLEIDADTERPLRERLNEARSFYANPLSVHEFELLAIVKLDFSGVKLPDDDRWSEPATHKTWEGRFDVAARTLRRWREDGFRMEVVPSRHGRWRVHREEAAFQEWEQSQRQP